MVDAETKYHINPTGRFVIGGPHGDTGLTGRKIIVDTYGGMGRHGGGAFSGKDPTKVDRSACYMARHIAKNIVAAGLASRCEVQLAYAIGVADPVSVSVNTYGTGQIDEQRLVELVRANFPLTPRGMIDYLRLRRPIYRKTAAFGHFGRTEESFTWEATNKAAVLREEARLSAGRRYSAARRPMSTRSADYDRTYDVKDIALADIGKRRTEWAFQSMPVLQTIRKQFIKTQPLAGIRIARLSARDHRDREPA